MSDTTHTTHSTTLFVDDDSLITVTPDRDGCTWSVDIMVDDGAASLDGKYVRSELRWYVTLDVARALYLKLGAAIYDLDQAHPAAEPETPPEPGSGPAADGLAAVPLECGHTVRISEIRRDLFSTTHCPECDERRALMGKDATA